MQRPRAACAAAPQAKRILAKAEAQAEGLRSFLNMADPDLVRPSNACILSSSLDNVIFTTCPASQVHCCMHASCSADVA